MPTDSGTGDIPGRPKDKLSSVWANRFIKKAWAISSQRAVYPLTFDSPQTLRRALLKLKCLESHPAVGAAGPTSNNSYPIHNTPYPPPGKGDSALCIREIADRLRSTNKGAFIEAPDLETFCFAAKTWVLKESGVYDRMLQNTRDGFSIK